MNLIDGPFSSAKVNVPKDRYSNNADASLIITPWIIHSAGSWFPHTYLDRAVEGYSPRTFFSGPSENEKFGFKRRPNEFD